MEMDLSMINATTTTATAVTVPSERTLLIVEDDKSFLDRKSVV